jgi:hypothetical protein
LQSRFKLVLSHRQNVSTTVVEIDHEIKSLVFLGRHFSKSIKKRYLLKDLTVKMYNIFLYRCCLHFLHISHMGYSIKTHIHTYQGLPSLIMDKPISLDSLQSGRLFTRISKCNYPYWPDMLWQTKYF